jgi:effector-binding domain-containing protein
LYPIIADRYDGHRNYGGGQWLANEPSVIEVAASRLLAAQRPVKWREIGTLAMPALDEVWASIRGRGIEGFGHNVFVYRNMSQDGADASFGVQVPDSVEAADGLVITESPGGRVATLTHWGPYDQLFAANRKLLDWCGQQKLELGDVSWEVYGDWSEDPAKVQTDIYFLLTT